MTIYSNLRFPVHIGIIMDGNGRWAKKHGKPRVYGHTKAVNTIRDTIRFCVIHNIKVLTLFAFSTENWKRPKQEISFLMNLITQFISKEIPLLKKYDIKLNWIGRRDRVNTTIADEIRAVENTTKNHNGLILNFAFDYGSRDEITHACRQIAVDVKSGNLTPEDVTEALIERYLYTSGIPDVDLIIRTSGEKRISNFLLWQGAYCEYCFFDDYWPDFTNELMMDAIKEYSSRTRRKGGVAETDTDFTE